MSNAVRRARIDALNKAKAPVDDATRINNQLDALLKPADIYPPPTFLVERGEMPEVPDGYWETAQEAAAQLQTGVGRDRGERLEGLVDQALDTVEQILEIQIDPYMPDSVRFMSVKKDAAVAVLTLANKVDENRFRKRSTSALLGILEKLTNAERVQTLG